MLPAHARFPVENRPEPLLGIYGAQFFRDKIVGVTPHPSRVGVVVPADPEVIYLGRRRGRDRLIGILHPVGVGTPPADVDDGAGIVTHPVVGDYDIGRRRPGGDHVETVGHVGLLLPL